MAASSSSSQFGILLIASIGSLMLMMAPQYGSGKFLFVLTFHLLIREHIC
jgi:hypothetical protein